MSLRFLYAASAVVFVTLLAPAVARGEDKKSWVGKKVIIKGPGRKIADAEKGEEQKSVATLTEATYVVVAEDADRIRLREKGVEGWLDNREAVLGREAVSLFTGR